MSQTPFMPTVLEDVDEEAVPSVQPSRCRVSAQDHAEVTLEDRVPASLPPDSDLFAIPDRETASFKAASVDDGMDKHIHVYDVSKFDGSYGFFAKELSRERRAYFTIVIKPLVLITLMMWMSLPVFWGALSNSAHLTANLDAWFINRDAQRIGNTLAQAFINNTGPGQHLGWQLVDPLVAGTNEQIMDAILQEQAWIAVVVEANATLRLSHARANGDDQYDPRSAITVYYAQARQEVAVGNYVLPITTQLLTESVSAYATAAAQRYFAQITPGDDVNKTAVDLLSVAPQTISPAISWNMVNLRPYTQPAAQAVTLVGNIFLVIFSFIMTMAHSAARTVIAPRLKLFPYLGLRLIVPFIAYLPLSLSYALVSLAFGLPFDGKFSYGGGFMLTFVFFYLGMLALGLALEAMITLLTPKFIPYFLFILIIYNVAPTLLPPELLNDFYSYGAGFPISNLSQAVRTIFFNTASNLVQNAGVMIGWICLSCGTLSILTWWMRRRELVALAADETTSIPERLSRELEAAHEAQGTIDEEKRT